MSLLVGAAMARLTMPAIKIVGSENFILNVRATNLGKSRVFVSLDVRLIWVWVFEHDWASTKYSRGQV